MIGIFSLFSSCCKTALSPPAAPISPSAFSAPKVNHLDRLEINVLLLIINRLDQRTRNNLKLTSKNFRQIINNVGKLNLNQARLDANVFNNKRECLQTLKKCSLTACVIHSSDILHLLLNQAPQLANLEISDTPLQCDMDGYPFASRVPTLLIEKFAKDAISHPALKALTLSDCKLTPGILLRLSPVLTRLSHLDLSKNPIGAKELALLFKNISQARLECLDLSFTQRDSVKALPEILGSGHQIAKVVVQHLSEGEVSELTAAIPSVAFVR